MRNHSKLCLRHACTLSVALFVGLFVSSIHAATEVGQVSVFEPENSFVYREVKPLPSISEPEDITENIIINHQDALKANDGSELKFFLFEGSLGEITVASGRLHLIDGDDDVKLIKVERGLARFDNSATAEEVLAQAEGGDNQYKPVTDLIVTDPKGTVYEIFAQARESRVYVYEGEVTVSSRDTQFSKTVLLKAGEWVRALEGQEISDKQRFIATTNGPVSGSSACIYSDCYWNNYVPVDPPLVLPLIPPNPNPPGSEN